MDKDNNNVENNSEVKFTQEELKKHDAEITKKVAVNISFNVAIIAALLLALVVLVLCLCRPTMPDAFQKIMYIKSLYDTVYVGETNEDELYNGAVAGFVSGSDDKYGAYLSPEKAQTTGKKLETGGYYGFGITYQIFNTYIKITGIMPYSPAARVNLPLDAIIVKINDEDIDKDVLDAFKTNTQNKTLKEVTFEDKEGNIYTMQPEEVSEIIVEHFVKDKIGYITIGTFVEATDEKFKEAIDDVMSQDVDEIVIDLRDNVGGELESVLGVLDYIVGEGILVTVDSKDPNFSDETEHFSDAFSAIPTDMPITLIVNENTASASELMVMTLQDYYNAMVIGTTTYGKSTVLSVTKFTDGSMLTMSTGYYYTKNPRNIEGIGIIPDIEISEEDYEIPVDEVFEKYIKVES